MKKAELIYRKTDGLAPFAYTIVGNWLYFCDEETPGLFRYHFVTEECECVLRFNQDYVKSRFFKIIAYENKLWLLPLIYDKISCFNLDTEEIVYYSISEKIEEKAIPFLDMFFWKGEAFLVPYRNNRFLLKIDLFSHNIQEIELLSINLNMPEEPVCFVGAVQFQNKIFLAESLRSIIMSFDLDNGEVKIVYALKKQLEDSTVRRIDDKLYFFPMNNKKVVIYDITKEDFMEREYPIRNLPKDEICIIVVFNKEIWILANKQKKIYQMDSNLEIETEIDILNFNKEQKMVYASGIAFSDRFFWSGHGGNPLIQVKDGVAQILDVSKNKSFIEVYIDLVNRSDTSTERLSKSDIGKKIYNQILY